MLKLLVAGNSKLGKIVNFSLPTGVTCPGATEFCERYCYGKKNWYRQEKRVIEGLTKRFEASKSPDFPDMIEPELMGVDVVRLHVTGDFYDFEYIGKWLRIVERHPNIVFYGYTKSWHVPGLDKLLRGGMKKYENFILRASTDFTHIDEPRGWARYRVTEGKGIQCPHDLRKVGSCRECRICWERPKQDIWTSLRWGKRGRNLSPRLL